MLTASITGLVTDHVTSFIGSNGVVAVFILMFIGAVLPIGSELVMLYGGALAAGAFDQKVVFLGHTIGSRPSAYTTILLAGITGDALGALAGWAIGVYGGRPFLERHGRWLHLSHERLGKAERWVDRFGRWAVFAGRITPVARSFIAIPAGVFRARLLTFSALSSAAAVIWCLALTSIGFGLGSNWHEVESNYHYVDIAVVVIFAGIVSFAVLKRWRSSRLHGHAKDSAD